MPLEVVYCTLPIPQCFDEESMSLSASIIQHLKEKEATVKTIALTAVLFNDLHTQKTQLKRVFFPHSGQINSLPCFFAKFRDELLDIDEKEKVVESCKIQIIYSSQEKERDELNITLNFDS